MIGFTLIGSTGFQYLFYFTGGLAFTAFFISIFTKERQQPSRIKRPPWTLRTGIVAIDALLVAWMALCMGIGFGAIHAFISIFAQSRGVQNPGVYFMVQAIALPVSRAFSGRLAGRYGRIIAIIPGIILMVVALALLPLSHGFPYFVASAALFGLGFGSARDHGVAHRSGSAGAARSLQIPISRDSMWAFRSATFYWEW